MTHDASPQVVALIVGEPMSKPIETDVIIIGGGLSGLAAALKITDANAGAQTPTSYLVLERDIGRLAKTVESNLQEITLPGGIEHIRQGQAP